MEGMSSGGVASDWYRALYSNPPCNQRRTHTHTMTTAARILSPIVGVKYVHQRNESKRKRDVAFSKNTTHSLNKEMIVRHVIDGIHNNKKNIGTP